MKQKTVFQKLSPSNNYNPKRKPTPYTLKNIINFINFAFLSLIKHKQDNIKTIETENVGIVPKGSTNTQNNRTQLL